MLVCADGHYPNTSTNCNEVRFQPEPKTGSGNRYVSEAIQYIKQHYRDPDISVSSVAQSLNISEGHLSHTFKKETGSTILGYLTRYRVHKAAELLKDCRVKVYEVAEQVGYRDIGYPAK